MPCKHTEFSSNIIALKVIYKNEHRVTLGSKNAKAKTVSTDEISTLQNKYHQNKHYKRRAVRPFDGPSVHVLFDARTFKGFPALLYLRGNLLCKYTSRQDLASVRESTDCARYRIRALDL